jgi:ribosomal protein S18 acetylase RimI-like enzyme
LPLPTTEARGRGAGTAALAALDAELRARDVAAIHLQVRPENPAVHLYERAGWRVSPRLLMTRRVT